MEVWKDIPGYKDVYQVSNYGRIKSLSIWKENKKFSHMTKEKIMKVSTNGRYNSISLEYNGARKGFSIHRLVYNVFAGEIPEGYIIHHKDSNKKNNNVNNLECMTVLKHNQHHHEGSTSWNKGIKYGKTEAYKNSNKTRKENYNNKCKEILAKKELGLSVRDLAKEYKCTVRTIYTILKKGKEYE